MLLVDKIGSGKTNDMFKRLLITDLLGPNETPSYSKIVCSGGVGENNETNSIFNKSLKRTIDQISPHHLMQF
jgi:hypothetical protein